MRFNVEIPKEKFARLKALMRLLEISTQKELFNLAITVFEWVITQRINGYIIAAIVDEEEGEYEELVLPTIETLWPPTDWEKVTLPEPAATIKPFNYRFVLEDGVVAVPEDPAPTPTPTPRRKPTSSPASGYTFSRNPLRRLRKRKDQIRKNQGIRSG